LLDEKPYDPLTYDNLGRSISEALLRRPALPLAALPLFNGAGIYALYYVGEKKPYEAYLPLAEAHKNAPFSRPIYVGKAELSGARKGRRDVQLLETKLADRLRQHAKSISSAYTTLHIDDFYCHYLIVESVWIPLGESILINLTRPVWNMVVEGFGNHDPGSGRAAGIRPMWDTIHPGRTWSERLPVRAETTDKIDQRIKRFFAGDTTVVLPETQNI